VLSSLGWVDRDSLWHCGGGAARTIPLTSGAAYCALRNGARGRFAVAHHFNGRRFEITVHEFLDPAAVIARVVVAEDESRVTGDASALTDIPPLYKTYLAYEPWQDYVLLELTPHAGITLHRLPWYDSSSDKDYQAVVDATVVPGTRQALISVQRSSRLIVQDLSSGEVVRTFDIGGGAGNPKLALRHGAGEIWTIDYDAVVVITTATWKVRKRLRLQDAAAGTQLFVGDLTFAAHQDLCVVARPYSHDVVALDVSSLKMRGRATLGREPIEAALMSNGDVIARDWKTGDLLRGKCEAGP
jgi:hypothetical protein